MTYYSEDTEVLTTSGPIKLQSLNSSYKLVYYKDGEFKTTKDFIISKDNKTLRTYFRGNSFVRCSTDCEDRITKTKPIEERDFDTNFISVDFNGEMKVINRVFYFLYSYILTGFWCIDQDSYTYVVSDGSSSSNFVVTNTLINLFKLIKETSDEYKPPMFSVPKGAEVLTFKSNLFPKNINGLVKAFLDGVYHNSHYIVGVLKRYNILSKKGGFTSDSITVKRLEVAKIMSLLFNIAGYDSYVEKPNTFFVNKYNKTKGEYLYKVYTPIGNSTGIYSDELVESPCVSIELPEDGDLVLFSNKTEANNKVRSCCIFGPSSQE